MKHKTHEEASGRVLQGYFRIERFRPRAAGRSTPQVPRPDLLPAKLRQMTAQPKTSPQAKATRNRGPRPDLLPAKLRQMTAQPKTPAQSTSQSTNQSGGAWSGAPRPELLPGMGPARVTGPHRTAQARQNHGASVTPVPPGQLRTIGEGRPLEPEIQQHMERFFEADFSGVRVHEGPAASAMGALAFTLGEQLHFAPGLYDPGSREGIELLGHELAHVVQQREGRVGNPYGQGVAIVQDPQLEAEADQMGRLVAQEIWSQAPVGAPARRNGARIIQSKRRAPGMRPGPRLSPLGPPAPMRGPGPLPRMGGRVSDAAVQRTTALVTADKRCTLDDLTGTGNDFKPIDSGWEQLSATQLQTFCDEDTDYPLWHVGSPTINHPCAYHGTWAFGGRTVVFFRYSPTKQDRMNKSWVGPNAHKAPRSQLLIKYQRLTQESLDPTVWRRSAHNEIAIDFCLETTTDTPKKKSKCFLSSACVQAHGLPDDCFELTTLRRFRDGYLQRLPTGPATIEQYSDLAPRILDGIEQCPDADARLEALYDELVAPCVRLIVSEQPRAALELYEAQVRALERRYLGDDDTES